MAKIGATEIGGTVEGFKKAILDKRAEKSTTKDAPTLPNLEKKGNKAPTEVDFMSQISSSIPSVNRSEVESQVRRELSPARRALEEKYDIRIGEQKEVQQDNIRSIEGALGAKRRFSTTTQAFVQWSNDQYNKKIADLETQRDTALASFDVDMATAINERIASERIAAQQDFENMMLVLNEQEKRSGQTNEKTERVIQSERDAAIIEAITGGAETLEDIFTGARAIMDDITIEDISTTMEAMGKRAGITENAAEKLTGDTKNFLLLKENYPDMLPAQIAALPENQQLDAYIQWMEGGSGTERSVGSKSAGVPGAYGDYTPGANGQFDSMATGLKVARAVFGGGQAMSDKDREAGIALANQGMKEGMTFFEMVSELSGFKPERNLPMANNLLSTLMTVAGEKGIAGFDMVGLSELINRGNDAGAIAKVENIVYAEAKKMDPDSFTSEPAVRIATDQVNELTKLLQDEGLLSEVGTFEGTMTQFLTKKLRGEKETKILNAVANLSADMRKELAGVAVTETELRFIEPLIPDIDQPAASFMVELNKLKTQPLLKLNAVRENYNLGRINEAQLYDRSKRVPLYSGAPQSSIDDFLNGELPPTNERYTPNVWGAPSQKDENAIKSLTEAMPFTFGGGLRMTK